MQKYLILGKNRAEACYLRLSELNNYVPTNFYTGLLTEDYLKKFSVIAITEMSIHEQIRISEFTHKNNIALIIGDTRGLFSQIFTDFGDNFTVIDTTGESQLTAMVASISRDLHGIVTCLDDTRHGLEDGDFVTFSEVEGMVELNNCEPKKIKVLGPYTFSIGDTSIYSQYTQGGMVKQIKMPKSLKFVPLREALQNPEIVVSDFGKYDQTYQLHLAFLALNLFFEKTKNLPKFWDDSDFQEFIKIAHAANREYNLNYELQDDLLEIFCKTAAGDVSPMNAVVGGIVAQEIMKACTGKFHPIYQWLYFDAIECLPKDAMNIIPKDEISLTGSRYDRFKSVFGENVFLKICNLKYFVIGAGAIGCELLKNFAMLGVGTRNGMLIVTDNDFIEKSNLNRQFLFRPSDVQKSKSSTAAEAIKKMNPEINILAHENRVGPETENIYNDEFFDALDGIANALDNIDARIYVDRRCVYYRKPLLESGTLGTKGNTQVIVPFLTESYSSSQDPPEKSIPICTLKNFPNAIEHTLQWARDEFEGLFKQSAENAAHFLEDPLFIDRTLKLPGVQPLDVIESVKKVLIDERPKSFYDCIIWAKKHWQNQYNNQIRQLLFNFPPDQVTSSGQPFWSGPKRCPVPLTFDVSNELHMDYIVSAANLKAIVYGLKVNRNREEIANNVLSIQLEEFTPKSGITIAETDSQIQISNGNGNLDHDRLNKLLSQLPSAEEMQGTKFIINDI